MSKNSGANGGRSSSPPSQRSLAMQYQPGRRPPPGHRSVNSVLVQDEPRSSDRHPRSGSAAEELKKGLRKLGLALLNRAVAVVSDKVDDVARALEDVATRGGPKASALLGGLRAKLGGRNAVWGAIRAGVTAMHPVAK